MGLFDKLMGRSGPCAHEERELIVDAVTLSGIVSRVTATIAARCIRCRELVADDLRATQESDGRIAIENVGERLIYLLVDGAGFHLEPLREQTTQATHVVRRTPRRRNAPNDDIVRPMGAAKAAAPFLLDDDDSVPDQTNDGRFDPQSGRGL